MEELLKEIVEKLNILIKINSLPLLKDKKYEKDKIKLLIQAGLEPKDIADIIQKDINNITAVISNLKKNKEI